METAAPPGTGRAALFTGHLSAANLRLHGRLGYRVERRERLMPAIDLVHLGKELPCRGPAGNPSGC